MNRVFKQLSILVLFAFACSSALVALPSQASEPAHQVNEVGTTTQSDNGDMGLHSIVGLDADPVDVIVEQAETLCDSHPEIPDIFCDYLVEQVRAACAFGSLCETLLGVGGGVGQTTEVRFDYGFTYGPINEGPFVIEVKEGPWQGGPCYVGFAAKSLGAPLAYEPYTVTAVMDGDQSTARTYSGSLDANGQALIHWCPPSAPPIEDSFEVTFRATVQGVTATAIRLWYESGANSAPGAVNCLLDPNDCNITNNVPPGIPPF